MVWAGLKVGAELADIRALAGLFNVHECPASLLDINAVGQVAKLSDVKLGYKPNLLNEKTLIWYGTTKSKWYESSYS